MSVSIRLGVLLSCLFTLAACGDPVVTRSRGGSDGGESAPGSSGAACYPNGTCNAGLNCVAGFCRVPAIGDSGGPCYPNSTCNGVLDCVDGRCQGADADTGTGCNQFTGEGCEDTGSADTGCNLFTGEGCADTGSADTGRDTGSTDTGSTDTGSTDTGRTDTGPTDTGADTTDTGPSDTGVADTTPVVTTDLCINAADRSVLAGDGAAMVTDAAEGCGLSCLGDADPGACAGDCLATETGLTNGCAGCYAGAVVCWITNCLAPCAADRDSRACSECKAANCIDDFNACTGPVGTDPGDTGTTDIDATDTGVPDAGPGCGNGTRDSGEACDDGNRSDGDGCSSICSFCNDDAGETDGLLSARNIEPTSCVMGALTLDGLVAQSNNADYFTFVAGPGTAIVSSLQADAEGVSFDLLDSAGTIIQAGVASGTTPGLVELNYIPTGIVGGSFILRASAEGGAECITYSISVCTNQG
jgi:cysteine-rich repeat protein